MINMHDVGFAYGGDSCSLQNINLHIEKKQITSIIGKNGCGKSTLIKLLCGQLKPQTGTIEILDRNIHDYKQKQLATVVSLLPQSRDIPSISVERLVSHGRFPYMNFPRKLQKNDIEIIKLSMEVAGVTNLAKCNIAALSGGERQRAYIAMLLCQDTPILLLDEPTTYLDVAHQFEFYKLIKSLDKTIVIVLHDLCNALNISDSICLLEDGRLAAFGSPQVVLESNQIQKIFDVNIEKSVNGYLLYK